MAIQPNQDPDDLIQKTLEVFKKHFFPAANLEESNEQMTPPEVLDKFQALLGEESIGINALTLLLVKNGYTYDYIGDEFLWLFKTSK